MPPPRSATIGIKTDAGLCRARRVHPRQLGAAGALVPRRTGVGRHAGLRHVQRGPLLAALDEGLIAGIRERRPTPRNRTSQPPGARRSIDRAEAEPEGPPESRGGIAQRDPPPWRTGRCLAPIARGCGNCRIEPRTVQRIHIRRTEHLAPLGRDAAEGQRLGDVGAPELRYAVEVGDGARDAQHAVVAAGGQVHAFGRAQQQLAASRYEPMVLCLVSVLLLLNLIDLCSNCSQFIAPEQIARLRHVREMGVGMFGKWA
jgi:hypothetical protein